MCSHGSGPPLGYRLGWGAAERWRAVRPPLRSALHPSFILQSARGLSQMPINYVSPRGGMSSPRRGWRRPLSAPPSRGGCAERPQNAALAQRRRRSLSRFREICRAGSQVCSAVTLAFGRSPPCGAVVFAARLVAAALHPGDRTDAKEASHGSSRAAPASAAATAAAVLAHPPALPVLALTPPQPGCRPGRHALPCGRRLRGGGQPGGLLCGGMVPRACGARAAALGTDRSQRRAGDLLPW